MVSFVAVFLLILCVGLIVVSFSGSGGNASARLGNILREMDSQYLRAGTSQAKPKTIRQILTSSKYAVRKRAEKDLLRMLRLFMMASLVLCVYTFCLVKNPPIALKWLSGLGAIMGMLPVMVLKNMRDARKVRIEIALINVIDLVVIGLEAGMTLPGILREIVQQEPDPKDPLKLELEQMLSEMDAGLDLNKALRGLTTRSEIQELNVLASAVVQAERVGSGLAQTFRIYGEDMRATRREKLKTKIQKLPIKMLLPMVAFLLFPLLVLILAPAMLKILTQFGGGGFG